MTILEGYFAKIKDYPETDNLICVSLNYPHFVKPDKMYHAYVLAPTPWLLERYKKGEMNWKRYGECYLDHLKYNSLAGLEIDGILESSSKGKTIRLMCYEKAEDRHCHRFLLYDILNQLEEFNVPRGHIF